MKTLTDLDRTPFGKHTGERMQDVPVKYLHWLWHSGLKNNKKSDVADYIRRNLAALRQENPDILWS
jgi:uncharacterized protein (DUF3820 family)